MTVLLWLLWSAVVISLGALVMTVINLGRYRPAPAAAHLSDVVVDVCIPARNEEANIEACVRSVLASRGLSVRVLVYDDQSTDATPKVLAQVAAADTRVHRVPPQPLPPGWNGKQHACWRLGEWSHAHPPGALSAPGAAPGRRYLAFLDADVRVEPDLLARSVAFAEISRSALVSTFPHQITGTFSERLVVPLIHFVLFSYLPMVRMQRTLSPAASAACGQFILADSAAYHASGGHAVFKASMHDGVQMPRAFRRAGFRTDLFDGTDLVSVRMYRGAVEVWRGFTKNAFEGLGSIALLLFITVLHLVGHVLPWVVLLFATAHALLSRASEPAPAGAALWASWASPLIVALAAACVVITALQRTILAVRFRQSFVGVVLHPVSMLALAAIQWWSWWLHVRGRRTWRGRTQG